MKETGMAVRDGRRQMREIGKQLREQLHYISTK
jgi:hypothetical protein